MNYELYFDEKALREWKSLDNSIKQQFKKKLKERLNRPKVDKDRLSGYSNTFKIKLTRAGYRLVYSVDDELRRIKVIVVGKRENDFVYNVFKKRG